MTKEDRAAKKALKLAEARVESIYTARCRNVRIDIMKISKVFDVGLAAIKAGDDDQALGDKIFAFVQSIAE